MKADEVLTRLEGVKQVGKNQWMARCPAHDEGTPSLSIKVRGDGGYVVVAPSNHASGRQYCWEVSSDPGEVPVAEWPPWLLERLRKPAAGACVSPANDIIPEGERNDTLTSLAGSMRRRGMPREVIRAALQSVNAKCCGPPLPETDLDRIAQSVARYPAADAEPGPEWPEPLSLPDGQPPVPRFDLNMLPGSLRPWVRDVSERMQCPPDYVAAAAMVLAGALVGRQLAIRPRRRDDWTVVPNLLHPDNRGTDVQRNTTDGQ